MNEVFEKIIEKLEEAKSNVPVNRLLDDIIKDKLKELGQLMAYDKAIEIVQQAGEEYDGGWIPTSERFPEESEYMQYNSTPYMRRLEIAYLTDIIEYKHGYYDGCKWMDKAHSIIENVVAWKIHEPYQPKGE